MTTAVYTGRVSAAISRNARYALAQALTATARNSAEDVRADMRRGLQVRNPNLTRYFVRSKAATPAKLVSQVQVSAPGSSPKRDRGAVLLQHDQDAGTGTKRPASGRSILVPAGGSTAARERARPNRLSNPNSWKSMQRDLRDFGKGVRRRKAGAWNRPEVSMGGLLATGRTRPLYLIRARRGKLAGRILLFERLGRGRRNTELRFLAAPQVRLRRRVATKRTIDRAVNRELVRQVRLSMAATLSRVRVGGLATSGGLA